MNTMKYNFTKKPYQYSQKIAKVDILKQFLETEYHALVITDQIQLYGLHNFIINDFKYSIPNILRDLNFLLKVSDQQFWRHLETQQQIAQSQQNQNILNTTAGLKTRLRVCLESCLIIFSRLQYYKYSQIKSSPIQISKQPKGNINQSRSEKSNYQQDESWFWYELKKVVLFIFYRISYAKTIDQKNIVFENWFLDTCKLLDICLVYGLFNPKIVKKIAQNLFCMKKNEYHEDFINCLHILRTRLEQICQQLKDFTINLQEISNISKYQNPSKNFIQRLMKTLFGVYDVCLNIKSIYNYFPQQEKTQILRHALIYKRLILIYNKIRYHADYKWKFAGQSKTLINVLHLIFKKIVQVLQNSIINIKIQLDKKDNPYLLDMKKTYINICYFTIISPAISWEDRDNTKKQDLYKKYCLQLIKNMILVDLSKHLFSEKLVNLFMSNQNSRKYLKKISVFQQKFRKQIKMQKQFRQKTKELKDFHLMTSLKEYFIEKQNKKEFLERQKIQILNQKQMKQYEDQPIQQQEEISTLVISDKLNETETHLPQQQLQQDVSKLSRDLFKKSKDQSGRRNQFDYFGKKQQVIGLKFNWDTNSQNQLSSINLNEEYYLLEDIDDFGLFDNSDSSDVNTILTDFSGIKSDFFKSY